MKLKNQFVKPYYKKYLDINIYISRNHYTINKGANKKMHKKFLASKAIAIAVIVLFIGMNTISAVGEVDADKYLKNFTSNSFETLNFEPECYPVFIGQKGENDWYIGDVFIMFTFFPERVKTIWYRITTEEWIDYNKQPFYFKLEGKYTFDYKWEDYSGNVTHGPTVESLRIDKTPPTIKLNSKVGGFFKKNKITFTANVNDGDKGSGIEKVEFYLDGNLDATVEESPYQYVYKGGVEGLPVTAIVYDVAGHSSNDNSTTDSVSFTTTFLGKILQGLYFINQIFIQILRTISPFK